MQSLPGSGLLCASCGGASEKAKRRGAGAGVGFLLSLALNDRSYLLPPGGAELSLFWRASPMSPATGPNPGAGFLPVRRNVRPAAPGARPWRWAGLRE